MGLIWGGRIGPRAGSRHGQLGTRSGGVGAGRTVLVGRSACGRESSVLVALVLPAPVMPLGVLAQLLYEGCTSRVVAHGGTRPRCTSDQLHFEGMYARPLADKGLVPGSRPVASWRGGLVGVGDLLAWGTCWRDGDHDARVVGLWLIGLQGFSSLGILTHEGFVSRWWFESLVGWV